MEKISVIVLVKNRQDHLRNLLIGLQRLNALRKEAAIETVIVHMNEQPQPPPDFFTGAYTTTEIHSITTLLPLAQARNQGAKVAKGDRLIFLDVDCIPAGDFLTDYEQAFASVADAILMGTVYYLKTALPPDWSKTDLVAQGQPHPARLYLPAGVLQFTHDYHLFWSLNFGLHKAVWHQIGGFDESFQGYGAEDTDFAFVAKAQGVPLAWLGGGTAFHQYHPSYSPPLQHFYDILRNAQVFHCKWQWWPMAKWLQQFVDAGYIEWSPAAATIGLVAEPSKQAIAAARQSW
ncbi:glycosyltransferase family 2 protein [Almyronema epifaneia]|uniref:Glycosyltransferase family 2 protein n=1 Tax=Almyronema epifaneia S1 TaxID=2991925 RepID=A0ABW6IK37_9CYAN